MRQQHRSPVDVVREWRLPADERRAARAERRVEALMRLERDSEWRAECRADRALAERRRSEFFWLGRD
jgi:hypothetical protein